MKCATATRYKLSAYELGTKKRGTVSLGLVLATATTLLASSASAQREPTVECVDCWHGACYVNSIISPDDPRRQSWTASCRLQHLPAEGFQNRWRFLLQSLDRKAEDIFLPRIADWVLSQVVADQDFGAIIWTDIPLWGRIKFVPLDPASREHLFDVENIPDNRPQNVTIGPVLMPSGDPLPGVIELLVDEPLGEFEDGIVSWQWWLRHWASIEALYGQ